VAITLVGRRRYTLPMTAACTQALLIVSVLARPFCWPGSLESDGGAVADLPEPQRPTESAPRLSAIDRLLANHGFAEALPFLISLLPDRDPMVRLYAARLLARAGVPAAERAAIAWITSPAVPLVDRGLGLDVLGHSATLSPEARAALEQALRDPEPATRAHALDALQAQPIGPSLSALLGVLDDDSREDRLQAVRLVGAAGDPRGALPLLDRLEDGDRQIRLQAIEALAHLADPRVVPALTRLTSEGTVDQRAAAIDALGALKATTAVPLLVILTRRRSDELAGHALLALGEIATPPATAALVAALRAPPVPEEVEIGLRQAGSAAVEALIGELTRGTPSSADRAATLLGEIGDRRATLGLCAAIDRGERGEGPPIALPALAALGHLGDPAAVPTLARAAESSDAEIRRGAFSALITLADPRSVALVEGGLGDPDPRLRLLATRLAAEIEAHAAAPALAARIADADPDVRRAAARALARVGDPSGRSVAVVLAALTRSDAPPRDDDETAAIGDALEAIAGGGDLDALARAFALARGGARAAIVRGLAAAKAGRSSLSDRSLTDRLVAALGDGGAVALAAADALAEARVPADAVPALARAFGDAEPVVRARLCPAIAGTPDGGAWLSALLEARDEAPSVRAAAAWAARGNTDARARLEDATRSADAAIAGNARAALAAGGRPGITWAAVRLRATDDTPLVGRWVTVEDDAGLAIQAMTDSFGVARVAGLPGGHFGWRAAGLTTRGAPTAGK
jgi:cellulose synthase operon protein C